MKYLRAQLDASTSVIPSQVSPAPSPAAVQLDELLVAARSITDDDGRVSAR